MSNSSNPKGRTTIEVGADGVAVITIINPPVNSLALDGTFKALFLDLTDLIVSFSPSFLQIID